MSVQTITATIGTTSHYWFSPRPVVSVDGSGVKVLDIVHGWTAEVDDQTPVDLSLELDDSVIWDVHIDFRGAAPVTFYGLDVTSGGDLFALLEAQGWQAL